MQAPHDFSTVTEIPGIGITHEALAMAVARYAFAAARTGDQDVLEIGCGAGQGLGLLAARARRVIGTDLTPGVLEHAREHYGERIMLVRSKADRLPMQASSVDVVVALEMLYYLPDFRLALPEIARVLRPAGRLVLSTINPRWADFNPSPFSTRYFDAAELLAVLREAGFEPQVFGGFRVSPPTWRSSLLSSVKQTAVRHRLVPRTMKGKEILKRLFLGPLVDAPRELRHEMARFDEPVSLTPSMPSSGFKVIYAVASR